jgi:hypothetical protein
MKDRKTRKDGTLILQGDTTAKATVNGASLCAKDTGRWLPGKSGNPAGRPQGARQRIAERLIADIADVWERHGQNVLSRLAVDDPAKLATIAYNLLPRDVFLHVENNSAIAGEDRRMLLDLLDVVKRAGAEARNPELVFQWIADDLRARLATPVQLTSDSANDTDEASK